MKTQVTQELLFNYFAGRVTPFQQQLVEEWAKDPTHREMFYAWLEAWENQHPQYLADVATGLARHQSRLTQPPLVETGTRLQVLPSSPALPVWYHRFRWMMAAAVALLLLVGYLGRDLIRYQHYHTGYGQTRQFSLADGSWVILNANSSLQVPRFGFGARSREVFLTGEAAFSVKHTPDHQQFVVKTDQQFEVLVLGTEFTVYNRPRGRRVVLNKGKVQLRYQEGEAVKQLTMQPGDQVTLDQGSGARFKKLAQPENATAWRDNRFVFEETTLQEIAYLFEETYGWQLEIPDPEIASWTVSGSFTARSGEELLETLMQASSLTYQRTGNRITIAASSTP